jgi:hypothetical protein
MPINSFLYPATQVPSGYEVANSLRFNDGSSDYLTKSFGTTQTSTAKFTVSVWVKRCTLGTRQSIFAAYDGVSAGGDDLEFETDDTLSYNGSGAGANTTSAKFRDVSAWYHIVLARDSSASGASNQVKIYVNGILQSLSTNSGCNTSQFLKNGLNSRIGTNQGASQYWVDMYMAELCVIDGQQLDPTSFGEFDSDTGIWKPIDVSGLTFGTNGFYLDFENSGSLGADVSGNSNNFTVNNLTSVDQSTDTCTNNFATLNPLLDVNATPTFTEGNLVFQGTGSTNFAGATIPVSSGKWYVEVKATTVNGSYPIIGVIDAQSTLRRNSTYFVAADVDTNNPSGFAVFSNGSIYHNNSSSYGALGTTYTSGDIIGLALDMDSGTKTLGFYKNGSLQTTINLDEPPSGSYMFASGVHSSASSGKGEFNFGNPTFTISSGNTDGNSRGNFEYAVPSGYLSLCTKNLSEVLG